MISTFLCLAGLMLFCLYKELTVPYLKSKFFMVVEFLGICAFVILATLSWFTR
jgi:hypothetical protein